MVGVMAVVTTIFQNDLCQLATAPKTVVQCPRPGGRLLSTHTSARDPGHSQASLAQALVVSLILPPGSWCTQVLFVPINCLFPQSCGSSVIKSHWSSKSNSHVFSVPLPDPQAGKSTVGTRTFVAV